MKVIYRYGKKNDYLVRKVSELEKKYSEIKVLLEEKNESIDLNEVDIYVSSGISQAELDTANNLKYLIVPFTGVNQLPLKVLSERGIQVLNSHQNGKYVAEKAIALTLALLGKIVLLDQNLRRGIWRDTSWTSLTGMKCGLVGMGGIGQSIVKYLLPFDCELHTLKRYEKKNVPNLTYHDTITELCQNVDIIFVSLPLTKETKGMINANILTQMKDKFIINVGRGDIINEADLYQALKEGTLKGAGIDVWYQYPDGSTNTYPSQFPIHELSNVVISPHSGGNATKCRNEEIDAVFSKLEAIYLNQPVMNIVNPNNEY